MPEHSISFNAGILIKPRNLYQKGNVLPCFAVTCGGVIVIVIVMKTTKRLTWYE